MCNHKKVKMLEKQINLLQLHSNLDKPTKLINKSKKEEVPTGIAAKLIKSRLSINNINFIRPSLNPNAFFKPVNNEE